MKNFLLLLMTPNMSLEKWNQHGYLSRELQYHRELSNAANLDLIIFSYGRNETSYIRDYPSFTVLQMPNWIPVGIPFKLQNLIYHAVSLIIYYRLFKSVAFAKTNQLAASPFGLCLKFLYSIPLVIRMGFYHSHFKKITKFKSYMEAFAFKFCDRVLVTSLEAGDFIAKTYKVDKATITSMCNSIDLALFRPLNLDKEYDLIFVGRLEKVKNIEFLIELISKLDLRTLIIGRGLLNDIVDRAVQRSNRITWLQGVANAELPIYYNQAKCFLLLSEYEGNPKALLEAMACGIPGIGANVPGIRECIEHNNTGILVDIEDIEIMKTEVMSLMVDKSKINMLGQKSMEWVKKNCDLKQNVFKEAKIYSHYYRKA